jgi:hypothetical protein
MRRWLLSLVGISAPLQLSLGQQLFPELPLALTTTPHQFQRLG